MGYVASLVELSISPRKGLHEDCNVSHHPHALLSVRTILIVLRLFNINKCPGIQHLKLPRALTSGTTTNKVGLASTTSSLAQLCASTEHEAAADTTETLRHGLQPSCLFLAYYHGTNLMAPTSHSNLPRRSRWNQQFVSDATLDRCGIVRNTLYLWIVRTQ